MMNEPTDTDPQVDQLIADAAASAQPENEPAPPPVQVPAITTCDVLIADDAAASRNIVAAILRQQGPSLRVRSVSSGAEAVKAYADTRAHVTLLDIDMPGMTGLEAMQRIREIEPAAFVGIVSGSSSTDNVRAALQGGANAFVVKPFASQRIVDVLRRFEKLSGRTLLPQI